MHKGDLNCFLKKLLIKSKKSKHKSIQGITLSTNTALCATF